MTEIDGISPDNGAGVSAGEAAEEEELLGTMSRLEARARARHRAYDRAGVWLPDTWAATPSPNPILRVVEQPGAATPAPAVPARVPGAPGVPGVPHQAQRAAASGPLEGPMPWYLRTPSSHTPVRAAPLDLQGSSDPSEQPDVVAAPALSRPVASEPYGPRAESPRIPYRAELTSSRRMRRVAVVALVAAALLGAALGVLAVRDGASTGVLLATVVVAVAAALALWGALVYSVRSGSR